ncbi:MAG TPA: hypothetical protein VFM88_21380 [Vicinamibacteria bacterium]|nr:hypothetical protein [Vicinamibacteria bacterium]
MAEARTPFESRSEALLAQGRKLLDEGRSDAAVLVFERILIQDPGSSPAREGLERARAEQSESARRREAGLRAARAALVDGDRGRAREILEGLLEGGGDRDAALSLLDRLDERRGLVALGAPSRSPARLLPSSAPASGGSARRAFAFGWALLTLSLAGSVAMRWERLVGHLTAAPLPTVRPGPPSTRLPAPTAGDVALAQARERSERGDVQGALGALDRVSPEDAAYPYARQLRERLDPDGAGRAR